MISSVSDVLSDRLSQNAVTQKDFGDAMADSTPVSGSDPGPRPSLGKDETIFYDPIYEPFTENMGPHRAGQCGLASFDIELMPYDRAEALLLELFSKLNRAKRLHPVDAYLMLTKTSEKLSQLIVKVTGKSVPAFEYVTAAYPGRSGILRFRGVWTVVVPTRVVLRSEYERIKAHGKRCVVIS